MSDTMRLRVGPPHANEASWNYQLEQARRAGWPETWAIESGVEVLYLARIMGTSVAQIEDTYARWLKRTDEQFRGLLDTYDASAL